MSQNRPVDSLILTYMSESHYHRRSDDDDMRPTCRPERVRGVLGIRREAERRGQTPCPQCWPLD